jgi:hypothetical protein
MEYAFRFLRARFLPRTLTCHQSRVMTDADAAKSPCPGQCKEHSCLASFRGVQTLIDKKLSSTSTKSLHICRADSSPTESCPNYIMARPRRASTASDATSVPERQQVPSISSLLPTSHAYSCIRSSVRCTIILQRSSSLVLPVLESLSAQSAKTCSKRPADGLLQILPPPPLH